MENVFTLPKFKIAVYEFNPQTGYYQKSVSQLSPTPINTLPFEVRRESARANQIRQNVAEILTIRGKRKSNGSLTLLTGLEPTFSPNWFIGDTYRMNNGIKVHSLLLFNFSDDNSKMFTYYFSGYYKHTPLHRGNFAKQFIDFVTQSF